MSTGVIIAIVVVVILIVLLAAMLLSPQARVKRRERELGKRRDVEIETQREQAGVRNERARVAQSQADIAAAEAEQAQAAARKEQAQAQRHEAQAGLHERGLADHELVGEDERDRFAGTSAVEEPVDSDQSAGGREGRRLEADEPGARLRERPE